MGLGLGNPLSVKGSRGLCAQLLEEESWVPSRGQDRQQELTFWGAGRHPSVHEEEPEGSHMQSFVLAKEWLGRPDHAPAAAVTSET